MAKNKKSEIEKQKRIENFEMQKQVMNQQGYRDYIGTISIIRANIMAFVTAGPFMILAFIIYISVWGGLSYQFNLLGYFIFLLLLTASLPLHEFIHGFTWHFFCKDRWKSIQFGVIWEYLTPYCHCREPLPCGKYLLGGLMPFLILGIGVSFLGIIFHSSMLISLGILNILAAGGDTTIACMAIKYRGCILLDHPTECGFIAFKK